MSGASGTFSFGSRYFDWDGRPMTEHEWASEFEKNRVLRRTKIVDDLLNIVTVSTVWLGIDHNFGPDGEPLIFETMVFGGEHDGACDRYSTKPEAVEGHLRWIRRVRGDA